MNEIIDLTQLKYNPDLGKTDRVVGLVKWTNQKYHDENLRSIYLGDWNENSDTSKQNSERHRQQYYDGLIIDINLSNEFLDKKNSNDWINESQPTDIYIDNQGFIIAANNRIISKNKLMGPNISEITNPWFARLHSMN